MPSGISLSSFVLLLALAVAPVLSAAEQRWRIVSQGPAPDPGYSGATELTAVNGKAFFAGWTPASGDELWTADTSGAWQLRELAPQHISSMPRWLHAVNGGVVFYPANLSDAGLWASDGTSAGTRSLPCPVPADHSRGTRYGSHLYYPDSAGQWWRTDGTAAGSANVPSMKASPGHLLAAAGQAGIYYTSGNELRFFDGESDFLLKSVPPESGYPAMLVTAEAGAVFLTSPASNTTNYWVTNGTPEHTVLVASDSNGQNPWLMSGGPRAWFVTHGEDGVADLWTTDGTAAGTRQVLDGAYQTWRPLPDRAAAAAGHRLLFAVEREEAPGQHGKSSVWLSDGSAAGTCLILDSDYGAEAVPMQMVAGGSALGFTREGYTDSTGGFAEVWRLSAAATQPQRLLRSTGLIPDPAGLAADESGRLWLSGLNGVDRLLGSAASSETSLILSPVPTGPREWLGTSGLRSTPQGLLFSAYTPQTGYEPWLSDGSSGGTRPITDLNTVPNINVSVPSSFPGGFTPMGGLSYFYARTPQPGIWRTDGTSVGTTLAMVLDPANAEIGTPALRVLNNNRLLFSSVTGILGFTEGGAGERLSPPEATARSFMAGDSARGWLGITTPETGRELWITDGSPAGTRMVRDIRAGEQSSGISQTMEAGEKLYFTADDGIHGRELWVSDGTVAGTSMIIDQTPGAAGTIIGGLAAGPDHLYFTIQFGVEENDGHWEILRIPLTGPAVAESVALIPMAAPVRALGPTVIRNAVRLRHAAFVNGHYIVFLPWDYELLGENAFAGFYHQVWSCSGPSGPARELPLAGRSMSFLHFTLHEGALYFSVSNSSAVILDTGAHAWRTDGTLEGHQLLNAGEESFFPNSTAEHAGRLYGQNGNLIVLNTQPAGLPPVGVTVGSRTAPATLTAAALTHGWQDPDGDAPGVILSTVVNGSLSSARGLAVPGDTTLTGQAQWTWQPPAGAQGSVVAFRLRAWDGQLASEAETDVTIHLPPWPAAYLSWADAAGLQGTARDPLAAPGGDGMANVMKFALGVPATVSASVHLPAVNAAQGMLILSRGVQALGAVDVFLEKSSNLQQWTDVPLDWTGAVAGLDHETLSFPIPAAPGPAYYRLRAVLR